MENDRAVVRVVCHWGLFKRSKKHEEEKKKKKIIGEETRLIKVVFKEADMLADWIEITGPTPEQQSALTKDFNNLIRSNYGHFCQNIILTFSDCLHPEAEESVRWRIPAKSNQQLFNSQDLKHMLTNDKHSLQSFLRPPSTSTLCTPATTTTSAPSRKLPSAS